MRRARVVDELAREFERTVSGLTAGQTGAAASQVLGVAQDLARQSERLSHEVASFHGWVEAA
ncbi:hypothetical protein [Methylobacterium platani]|uniref:Uncharacterized protein n=2 Tax=Methylobacterium platani TaxID=427683 RepID=A0A179S4V1_9HYPH|nr:hypothetical protein [Methylobacterium platani]KMO15720.1 hypothetical protein SQ03_16625 [Methylobacterium platani JCM 14648]OAS20884.1 hypothetical protein A5481_21300 [Methylobacterium platani]